VELKRRLYTRGSSYETTIPKPLLFSRDLTKKHLVTFIYDERRQRWYIEFEEVDVLSSRRGNTEFEERGAPSVKRGAIGLEEGQLRGDRAGGSL
jgi:hypothetical protein